VRGDARVINEQREEEKRKKISISPFRASGEVFEPRREMVAGRKNEDLFANYKAQSWWSLRLRFQETYRAVVKGKKNYNPDNLISIPSKGRSFEKLMEEITQPTWTKNGAGKILIDKKPDGAKSPNLADAVNIAYSTGKRAMTINDDALSILTS
jgi:phage terminase large subunit